MVIYMVDECLPKLELLTGEGTKNYEISLVGSNSHQNRVSSEIKVKN